MATAAVITSWQHNPLEIRSLGLATAHGFTLGAVRYGFGTGDGYEVLRALSERTHRYEYEVTYCYHTDRVVHCTCPARGACKHRGSARMWVEQRKARADFYRRMEAAGAA